MLTASCATDTTPCHEIVVVEGWIDADRYPIVHLTRTMSVSDEQQDIHNLKDYLEQWAKVSISDGENEVILNGIFSDDYFPPYVYTTTQFKGKVGKKYTLTVECIDGSKYHSVTEIMPKAELDSFRIMKVAGSDLLREIIGYINIDKSAKEYYKVFVHVNGGASGYESAYMGIASSDILASSGRMPIYNGSSNLRKNFTPYFKLGDTVSVKLARVDESAYRFWREFSDLINLSRNPLFPVTNNLYSNIEGDALGYWFGYGSSFYVIPITDNPD